MLRVKNICVKCKSEWKVNLNALPKLDVIDKENYAKLKQLFSICEDCSDSGECESVLA